MLEKLAELEKRYDELSEQLADPDLINDYERYKVVAKDQSELKKVVEKYREWQAAKKDLADNQEALADPELAELAREEIPQLEKKVETLEQELKVLLLPKDPYAGKNVIIEIRAGTGGNEASLFAGDLYNMYARYADRRGWKTEILGHHDGEVGGFKDITVSITGENVYRDMKWESGVHRVQRVPKTEASGRKHTSTATVAVLPEADEVDVDINPADLEIDVYRASGAGGQHVNKTESAVRITHLPSGIVVTCQDERSQHKNRSKAMKQLRAKLLDAAIQEQAAQQAADRKGQVGTGDRSERIRTYNFHEGRVTDHRIGLTLYKLDQILLGDLDELIEAVNTHYQTEALKASGNAGAEA